MRHPVWAIIAIGLVIFNACGRQDLVSAPMTREEAIDTLKDVPIQPKSSSTDPKEQVSAQGLHLLLKDLVASGELKIPSNGTRNAVAVQSAMNWDLLKNIFEIIQSGKAISIWNLAKELLAKTGGTTTDTKSRLDTLLQILTAALPIIAVVAPVFTPVVKALTVVLPIVIKIISFFKRPKTTPTTALLHMPVVA